MTDFQIGDFVLISPKLKMGRYPENSIVEEMLSYAGTIQEIEAHFFSGYRLKGVGWGWPTEVLSPIDTKETENWFKDTFLGDKNGSI